MTTYYLKELGIFSNIYESIHTKLVVDKIKFSSLLVKKSCAYSENI